MKYIKLFENYPSPRGFTPNSIEEDVNDMFIELKDDGYKIEYQRLNERGDSVSLTIKLKYRRVFNSNDVREYVMMFIDYMTDKFGEQRVFYRGRTSAYVTDDTFYAAKVVTTDDFPDDIELIALKIGVDARYKDKNQTKLQLENYIGDHYLDNEVTPNMENEFAHKVESGLRDILVELFDKGMQVQVTWTDTKTIRLIFHYPLDDNGSPDDIFKIGDIYEYCLMIDEYMKDFWEEAECSYDGSMNRVWNLKELKDKYVRFVRMYINKIPLHKQRALY